MRDQIPTRLQNAWWVHPHTGEVIPVHAHAKTVADDPKKFGLTHSDVGDVGGGQRFNPFDRKAGSAAQDTITAANKNGWVRVRNVLGRGAVFQVHGNAHEIPKVIGHLEKKGIKMRGPATVDDPGHQFTKTYSGGTEALKTANLGTAAKVAKAGSGDAEVWHNMDDGDARDLLRARLHARAGLPMEERMLLIRRIGLFLGENSGEHALVVVHPGSLCGSLDFNLGSRKADEVRKRISDHVAAHKGPVVGVMGNFNHEIDDYPEVAHIVSHFTHTVDAGPSNTALTRAGRAIRKEHGDNVVTGAWGDADSGCATTLAKASRGELHHTVAMLDESDKSLTS